MEARITPTVRTWSGAIDNIWTRDANWDGHVQAGDDLVFPAGAIRKISVNNFPIGTTFHSMTVADSGYTIEGASLLLDGALQATYTSGSSNDTIDTTLTVNGGAVSVAPGATLHLGGAIGGTPGITLSGGGDLVLDLASVNSYAGTTTVNGGSTLTLSKAGVVAIPGALIVNSGTALETAPDQIGDTAPVTVDSGSTLDLGGNNDIIGALTLSGGTVHTGAGLLTLNAASVTVNDPGAAVGSSITGHLALTVPTTFTVPYYALGSGIELDVAAVVSGPAGAGITKASDGLMKLEAANTFDGATSVNLGVLELGNAQSLGNATRLTTVNNGSIQLDGVAVANPLSLAGIGDSHVGTALFGATGQSSWTGPIALAGNTYAAAGTNAGLTLSGLISDGGSGFGLGFDNNVGTVTISGTANTFTGLVDLTSGTLAVTHSGGLNGSVIELRISDGASFRESTGVNLGPFQVTVQGAGVGGIGAIEAVGGNATLSGPIYLTGNTTVSSDTGTLTLSGAIAEVNPGYSLTKLGAGGLKLSGADTYTGATTVSAGSLEVDGSITSNVGLASGTTLQGEGTVGNVSSTGATTAPGTLVPGTLTTHALTLDAASTMAFRLDGNTPGTGAGHYDQAVTTGNVTLAGATLSLTLNNTYTPGPGDQLTIISNGSGNAVSGTFSGLPEGSHIGFGPGKNFVISYTGGLSGHDVVLSYVQDTATALVSSDNSPVYGESITLTATVTAAVGTPTGTVKFYDGATLLGTGTLVAGVTHVSTPALGLGPHSFTAVYQGDTTDAPSTSAALPLTVGQASTSTAVASSGPTVFGQSVTFTATVSVTAPGSGTPTGNVSFLDGATLIGTVAVDNTGHAAFSTSSLSTATHSITAHYAGDTNFVASTSPAINQVVSQASTTSAVVAAPTSSVSGQSVVLTATVVVTAPGAGTPTGLVSFFDGASLLGSSPLLPNGHATFTTAFVNPATHALTAVYSGDVNFVTSTSPVDNIIVSKASSAVAPTASVGPIVHGESTTFIVAVTAVAPGAGIPTGSVTVFDNATLLGIYPLNGSGQASVSDTGTTVGTHTITMDYSGDANFLIQSSTFPLVVNQAAAHAGLSALPNPSVFGQSVTFTSAVSAVAPGSGVPTGTVDFYDGASLLGSGTLAGGVATFTTSSLPVGVHPTTAVYLGDANFTGASSSALSFDVNQASTSLAIATSGPTVYGQSVTFTATLSVTAPGAGVPTGLVHFYDGATDLGSTPVDPLGHASLSTSTLSAATHPNVYAAYVGDTNFAGSTATPITQIVSQASTTTTIVSAPNPSVYGQSVLMTATVAAIAPGAGVPTGHVHFFDGATQIADVLLDILGTATFSTSALTAGSHNLSASYLGDPNFHPSASPLDPHAVIQALTATTVSSSANPSVYGETVTFTALVSAVAPGAGIPTGIVTFFDGASLLGSGSLDATGHTTFTTASLGIGPHSISTVYEGDPNFAASASTVLNQVVNKDAVDASVSALPISSVFGQSVTFTATVSASAPGSGLPTGQVDFLDGATILAIRTLDGSGQATFSTSALTVATHPITILYEGDARFLPGTSSILNFTVSQAATASTITSGLPNPSVYGQAVTFSATVASVAPGAGIPTGQVDFYDGPTLLGHSTLDLTGATTFTTSALLVGGRAITAHYAGDASYLPSVSSAYVEGVNQASTTLSITTPPGPLVYGQSFQVVAHLAVVAPGAGTPTGVEELLDGATVIGTMPADPSGTVTFNVPSLPVGAHSLSVAYVGDANFVGSTSTSHPLTVNQALSQTGLTSSSNPSVFGQTVTFTATVTIVSPGSGTPTGTVSFFDGATTLGTSALNAGGVATLALSSLPVSGHAITAVYNGSTDFVGSTSAVLAQVVNQAATSATLTSSAASTVFGQSVTFTATVAPTSPGAGTPTGIVSFFDGATLLAGVALDGTGHATFTTSGLSVATHSMTAVYGGDVDFLGATSPVYTQLVARANTTASVVSSDPAAAFGQPVTFTATVLVTAPGAGAPTGLVTFFDGATSIGSSPLDNTGHAAFTTSALSVGAHSITAVYAGDTSFNPSTSPVIGEVVTKASTTTLFTSLPAGSVFGQSVTFTAAIAVVAPGSAQPTGSVTFYDGAILMATVAVDNTGHASFATTNLSVATHSLAAFYSGDSTVHPSSATLSYDVSQASTTVALSSSHPSPAPDPVYGEPITFTALVSPVSPGAGHPSGTVNFFDGLTLIGSGTLDNTGHATFIDSGLTAGSHAITAHYLGDTSFVAANSSILSQSVSMASTGVALTPDVQATVFGQAATLVAQVSAVLPGGGIPTGTVTFKEGLTVLGSSPVDGTGKATFSTGAFAVGTHFVTASYGGDPNFVASVSTLSEVDVSEAATTTSIVSGQNPSGLGQPVTFTVSVATQLPGGGVPTGLVEIMNGATSLGTVTLAAGQATFTTSTLPVGGNVMTAIYEGDPSHTGSTSAPLVQSVHTGTTLTTLGSSVNPSVTGQPVILTATVNGSSGPVNPQGTVVFYDGLLTLGSASLDALGHASIIVANVSIGTHSLTAAYTGDPNFIGSVSLPLTQVVNAASTSTALVSSGDSVFGQSVNFTATVSATSPGTGVPAGIVTFLDGVTPLGTGTLDALGVAHFSTTGLGVGSHSITASYGGSVAYHSSVSPVLTQLVETAVTTGTLTPSVASPVNGQAESFLFTVAAVPPGAGMPTGNVEFFDGATDLGTATLSSGAATWTTSTLAVGSHSITAVYEGNASFEGFTSNPLSLTVAPAATATGITAPVFTSVSGQWVTFTANVYALAPGVATPGAPVTFLDGSTPVATVTPVNGIATWTATSLPIGVHQIMASYAGGPGTLASDSLPYTLTVKQASATVTLNAWPAPAYGQPVTFVAKVSATPPGGGTPTGVVVFADNGVNFGSAWVVGGKAKTVYTLSGVGTTHVVTATYLGNTNFKTASASFTATVAQAGTSTMLSSIAAPALGGSWIVAHVQAMTPGGGTPTGTVTFVMDGVALGTRSLANGQASIFVAGAGGHTFTARYNGNPNLYASVSPPLTLGSGALRASARPMAALAARGSLSSSGKNGITF